MIRGTAEPIDALSVPLRLTGLIATQPSTNHPQAEFPNVSSTLRNSKVGLCRRSTRYWHQKPSNDKQSRSRAAESALSFSTSQVTLAQCFLEVGTELFEAIKNYDAEALIGLQKDQIFTFLQVEAQHSKLLLHSENILWYARCTIIQYRRLEV